MARLSFAPSASIDQAEILEFLSRKAGQQTAEKFVLLFRALYDRLAIHPEAGPLRPALGRHTRIGIVAPYIRHLPLRPG